MGAVPLGHLQRGADGDLRQQHARARLPHANHVGVGVKCGETTRHLACVQQLVWQLMQLGAQARAAHEFTVVRAQHQTTGLPEDRGGAG